MFDFMDKQSAQKLNSAFTTAGFELRAAGGCVRDSIMNKVPNDIDFCTDCKPSDMIDVCSDFKVFLTGFEHGTITVVVDDDTYEITTLRSDTECDGRFAKVEYITSFEEDARRRDLTINSLMVDFNKKLYDYFDGVSDINNSVVKFIGNPSDRINEDNLRILRFIRFGSKFNKPNFDKNSVDAIIECRSGLNKISKERILSEIKKIAVNNDLVKMMAMTGVADVIGFAFNDYFIDSDDFITNLVVSSNNPVEFLINNKASSTEIKEAEIISKYKNTDVKSVQILGMNGVSSNILEKICFINNFSMPYIPSFPVRGQDLIDTGMKPGVELGKSLNNMKERFISSNFTMSKNQLMSLIF
jgi:tRNA nucleotidyltransferase/poly(A) polymerase